MSERAQFFGVYRVLANGKRRFVSRTVTANRKLAEDLARGFTNGEIVLPDGSTQQITPHPHIAHEIPPPISPELR